MNKFLKSILITFALSAAVLAQHPSVNDINYGNGAVVKESTGTGVPTDACSGLARYTQTNPSVAGQNIWQCVSGHMVQQATASTDSTARTAASTAQTTANAAIPSSTKGAANGVASLNSSTLVPPAQLGLGTLDSSHYLDGTGHFTTPPGGTYSVFGASGTSHSTGLVPDPGASAGTARYLREDGTFATPPGSSYSNFVAAGTGHAAGLVPDPGATAHANWVLHSDGTWGEPYKDTSVNTYLQFAQAAGGTDVLPTFVANVPTIYLKGGQVYIQYGITGGSPVARISDINSPFATVTDGATVAWNATSPNGTLTLVHTTASRTLNVSNLSNGEVATLLLFQDATGGITGITLGTGCTWRAGGAAGFPIVSTLTLTAAATNPNILVIMYDGTNCFVNLR